MKDIGIKHSINLKEKAFHLTQIHLTLKFRFKKEII